MEKREGKERLNSSGSVVGLRIGRKLTETLVSFFGVCIAFWHPQVPHRGLHCLFSARLDLRPDLDD